MSFLQKIKSLFGGTTNGERTETDTTVTVEREPGESTDTEHASADDIQKAPETVPGGIDDETESDDTEADTAMGADQAAVSGGDGDESDVAEPKIVTEANEADADGAEANEADADGAESEDESAEASKIVTETGDDGSAGEPIEQIKGIGPAYGNRLGEIGIETVTQLAAADPAEVAEQTGVGESRASTWIDRAKEY